VMSTPWVVGSVAMSVIAPPYENGSIKSTTDR